MVFKGTVGRGFKEKRVMRGTVALNASKHHFFCDNWGTENCLEKPHGM